MGRNKKNGTTHPFYFRVITGRGQFRMTIPKPIAEALRLQKGSTLRIVMRDKGFYVQVQER